MSNAYIDHLEDVAQEDVRQLLLAEKSYGDSWKKRGGVGAFMMLARKWDRLENRVSQADTGGSNSKMEDGSKYDIFAHIREDPRLEGVLDDLRDLRRYLMLVEAEMIAQGHIEVRGHAKEEYRGGNTSAVSAGE